MELFTGKKNDLIIFEIILKKKETGILRFNSDLNKI